MAAGLPASQRCTTPCSGWRVATSGVQKQIAKTLVDRHAGALSARGKVGPVVGVSDFAADEIVRIEAHPETETEALVQRVTTANIFIAEFGDAAADGSFEALCEARGGEKSKQKEMCLFHVFKQPVR